MVNKVNLLTWKRGGGGEGERNIDVKLNNVLHRLLAFRKGNFAALGWGK